jgi:cytidylate kinase
MKSTALENSCLAYLGATLSSGKSPKSAKHKSLAAITISRQAGARGHTLGRKLVSALQGKGMISERPWALFDEDLVEKVLQDRSLPERLAAYMPEASPNEIQNMIEEVLGLHPAPESMVEMLNESIRKLVDLGHVIIVGRAGNLVVGDKANVLRVLLVGSFDIRCRHMSKYLHTSLADATAAVKKEDKARRSYARRFFSADIEDPLNYDLVINTDRLPDDRIVATIMAALQE